MIILIPDYTFADRVELDNCREGTFHKRCDIECKSVWGYLGKQKIMGERCIGCGYTVWMDPTNSGIFDGRKKRTIWKATKRIEKIVNQLGIKIKEVERW